MFEEVLRVLQGSFKGVQVRLRGDLRVSKRSSKGVKREFEGSFKESVCVLQENLKKKKLQGCFKNVSIKFCLTNLLLHGSHRSFFAYHILF